MTADTHNWIHASGTDYQYDAAGNMTYDATSGLNYSFDQENRITGAAGYTYTYDGDGNRVRKSNGNAASSGTLYWYMTPGVVAESDLAGTLKSEYIFFDGERVARKDFPGNTVAYYFSDHLKTASVITDASGVIKADSDYYPWGGELQFVNDDSNDYKFTGKKRDAETGLDYFGARYYSNSMARFMSVDLMLVDKKRVMDPQRLNMLVYARNNPTRYDDPDGADPRDKINDGVHVEVYHQPYTVHGYSANNANSNAQQAGYADAGYSGITKPDIKYKTENSVSVTGNSTDGYTATVTATVVDVNGTITVWTPEWAEESSANQGEQATWEIGKQTLNDHEQGHVEKDLQGAQKLHDSLKGTQATGKGKTPDEAVKKAKKAEEQKLDQKAKEAGKSTADANTEYDRRTQHGQKQYNPQK